MDDPKAQDLSRLTIPELRKLADRIEQEISARQEEGRRWLRSHGLVERRGLLYRNPQNAAETWNGRGSRPDWVTRALAAGRTLESLEADAPDRDLPVQGGKRRG